MEIIRTQRQLRQALTNAKNKITDKELFFSNSYKDFLNAMIDGVTKRFQQPVILNLYFGQEEETAGTDGNQILVNINNRHIKDLPKKEKHSAIIATVLHECAHILFTDFKLHHAVTEKLMKENYLYPQPEKSDELDRFNQWIISNNAGKDIIPLYHSLDNCIEDGYVDNRIIQYIPGYGKNRVWFKKIQASDIPSYEDMKKNKDMDSITIFLNMVLSYAKYGLIQYDKTISENDELIQIFFRVKLIIDEAITITNSVDRKRKINEVLCHMFTIIMNEWDKQQNTQSQDTSQNQNPSSSSAQNNTSSQANSQQGQDGTNSGSDNSANLNNASQSSSQAQNSTSQSNSSNYTSNSQNTSTGLTERFTNAQLSQIINNASQALKQSIDSNHKNTEKLKQPDNIQASSDSNSNPVSDSGNNNSSMDTPTSEKEIEQLLSQAAYEKVANEQEKNISEEMNRELRGIAQKAGFHKNVASRMDRVTVTQKGEALYNTLHTELDSIARRLVKNMEKEIKERKLGDTLNGLYMGKRIDGRSLYRQDKKVFTKKIQPENIPDMEVSLLIDLSGSMRGDRINASMKAAYILYSFCEILHIPVSVYGHHVSDSKVCMKSYTDGTSLDGNDKKRIFEMNAGGCNRDGYALRYCLNHLKNSEATTKIQIIISDGKPNDSEYHFAEGKADIQEAVAEARKYGIITIAAAIGDDTEHIKSIYTEGISEKKSALFLDITELDRLPKTFPQIIKRYLI